MPELKAVSHKLLHNLRETCAPKWSCHFEQKSYIKEGNAEKMKTGF